MGLTCPAYFLPTGLVSRESWEDNPLLSTKWLVKDLEPEFHPRCLWLSFSPRVFSCCLQPLTAGSLPVQAQVARVWRPKLWPFPLATLNVSSSLIVERGSEVITVLCVHPAGLPQLSEIKSHTLARCPRMGTLLGTAHGGICSSKRILCLSPSSTAYPLRPIVPQIPLWSLPSYQARGVSNL